MTLIRSLRSLFPCPKCLVSKDDLANLYISAPARTAQGTINVLNAARAGTLKGDKEQILKNAAL